MKHNASHQQTNILDLETSLFALNFPLTTANVYFVEFFKKYFN